MNIASRALASLNPLALLRRRFQSWWQARLRASDSQVLTQRNVYILPTRPGFMLAFTLLLLLVGSINYQLNLGYLLTFLLAGSAVVGIHMCHGTLRGLTLSLAAPDPQFAGSHVLIDIRLLSNSPRPRHGIGLSALDPVLETTHWVWTDVPAAGSAKVQIAWRADKRGLLTLPMLTAETRFPLGTFRVWTIWRPAAKVLIYPAPEPNPPPLPAGEPRASGAATHIASSSGEFDGVRAYRVGDPIKSVVWKKSAKALAAGTGDLVSRDTQQNQRYELWLDYAQAGYLSSEAKLSRLCAWVLRAERLGQDYGLRLPGQVIAPSMGEAHKRRCLEALALC